MEIQDYYFIWGLITGMAIIMLYGKIQFIRGLWKGKDMNE